MAGPNEPGGGLISGGKAAGAETVSESSSKSRSRWMAAAWRALELDVAAKAVAEFAAAVAG